MTHNTNNADATAKPSSSGWRKIVARYQKASISRATWQLINTLVPYVALWVAMYYCKDISWWLVVPLAILAGGFLVRTFIIFHDCGHSSFFKSRRANDICGFITGVITLTPYYHWRWEHAIHHGSTGNLNKRGTGDIWTMTVQEYLDSSRWQRFSYRLSRNPIILFIIAPLFVFAIWQRRSNPKAPLRERRSVYYTNFGILIMALGLSYLFGWQAYLIIQSIIMVVGGAAGIWLFYVQHQFEGAYWEQNENWDYTEAALKGSSFYKLPKILQWFSGNIGFHHIHHLSPLIPNYHLEKCHKSEPLFQTVKPITLLGSRKSLSLRLWDEKNRKLVGYKYLRQNFRKYFSKTSDHSQGL